MFMLITTQDATYSFVAAPGALVGQFAAYTGGAALEGTSHTVFVDSLHEAVVGKRLHIPGVALTSEVTSVVSTLDLGTPAVAVLDPNTKAKTSAEAIAELRKRLGADPANRVTRPELRPGRAHLVGTPAYYA